MVTATRTAEARRNYVLRAQRTGAAPRARKRRGIGLADAARANKVDNSTYYRWEQGKSMPTHDGNLAAFVRYLKRLGVDDDPAMHNMTPDSQGSGTESAESS